MASKTSKFAALALSGAMAVTAFAPAAQADHIYRDYADGTRVYQHHDDYQVIRRQHRRHRDNDVGAAIALGVGALALGAIIANSDNNPPPRRVYRTYEEPRVVRYRDYGGALEPWSPEWYDYCDSRYRSFNPRTGTYRGYDGYEHFCEAN